MFGVNTIDWTIVAWVFGGGLLMFAAVMLMLRRSWGAFPSRIEMPQPQPEQPRASSSTWADRDTEDAYGTKYASPSQAKVDLPDNLILIAHPMVRSLAERAIADSQPMAQYFARDGNNIYVALDRIQDPGQRRMAATLLEGVHEGSVSVFDMVRFVRDMNKR